MNTERLIAAGLASAVAFLVVELTLTRRERNDAHREFEHLVGRLADRPTTALAPVAPVMAPVLADEPTYVSDLPYHDDFWDEIAAENRTAQRELQAAFAEANESLEEDEDD